MQWQKELYRHEELPPPYIWEEMKQVLSSEPYKVRETLFNFTENPPSDTWEQVFIDLKKSDEIPTLPVLHQIRKTALSYAAAIIGIGLFISILVFLMNNKSNEVGVKDLAAGLNFQDSPITEEIQKDTGLKELANKEKNQPELQDLVTDDLTNKIPVHPPTAKKNPVDQSPESGNESGSQTPVNIESSKINVRPATRYTNEEKVSYADGNYILVMNPAGEPDRVSYKLSGMVKSLHTKENSGKSTSAESRRWNKVLTAWKEKMGQSDFFPAGSNFFDIAEMAELLNSEQ